MKLHRWISLSVLGLFVSTLSACASSHSSRQQGGAEAVTAKAAATVDSASVPRAVVPSSQSEAKRSQGQLICRASKKRFYYDWNPNLLKSGGVQIGHANDIRFEFRSANRPAGKNGENLKIGECSWAEEALIKGKKTSRSRVFFNSLSDEATQTFYKMKNGHVFKVPVRETKNGLVAAPGGVSLVR